MIVCIDYDGTITQDPKLFLQIVELIKSLGHKPIVCTMRYPYEEDNLLNQIQNGLGWGIPVYYSSRMAKMDYLEQVHNIKPDIWIDDNPIWIYKNAE